MWNWFHFVFCNAVYRSLMVRKSNARTVLTKFIIRSLHPFTEWGPKILNKRCRTTSPSAIQMNLWRVKKTRRTDWRWTTFESVNRSEVVLRKIAISFLWLWSPGAHYPFTTCGARQTGLDFVTDINFDHSSMISFTPCISLYRCHSSYFFVMVLVEYNTVI